MKVFLIWFLSFSAFGGQTVNLSGKLLSYNDDSFKIQVDGKEKRFKLTELDDHTLSKLHSLVGKQIIFSMDRNAFLKSHLSK